MVRGLFRAIVDKCQPILLSASVARGCSKFGRFKLRPIFLCDYLKDRATNYSIAVQTILGVCSKLYIAIPSYTLNLSPKSVPLR